MWVVALYKLSIMIFCPLCSYRLLPEMMRAGMGEVQTAGPEKFRVFKTQPRRKKMKKFIAVAAGLMLTGAMVTTASAAVSFSGDARVRGYYEKDYDFGIGDNLNARTNEKKVFANSRYRVKVHADAAGGAYVRSRILISNGTHGTVPSSKTGVDTDYMYLGVPMGPVTLEGGRMPANITTFFLWDRRYDMIIGKWSNEMTAIEVWYNKLVESGDLIDDNDVTGIYGLLKQKFAGDWGMTLAGAYLIDDVTEAPLNDRSGFTGTIEVSGPAGPLSLTAAFAYQEGDLAGSEDDGYGGYIEGSMNFGATTVALNAGWAQDGFAADDDFGFIMIGGASSITPAGPWETLGGTDGNTTWFGGKVGFKASEALTLTGILAYATIDDIGDAFEISGRAKYMISDGASVQWDIGYLSWSADTGYRPLDRFINESDPFGTALTFEISF